MNNEFVFPAFLNKLFSLIGVVCHTPDHYYSYVTKHGEWYIIDCVLKPHVKQIKYETLQVELKDVSIMLFERTT